MALCVAEVDGGELSLIDRQRELLVPRLTWGGVTSAQHQTRDDMLEQVKTSTWERPADSVKEARGAKHISHSSASLRLSQKTESEFVCVRERETRVGVRVSEPYVDFHLWLKLRSEVS